MTASFEVVRVDSSPKLRNQQEVGQAMITYFPRDLRDRIASGRGSFLVLIDPDGRIVQKRLYQSAAHAEFNVAGERVFDRMRFSPAIHQNCRIPFSAVIPFAFESRADMGIIR